jgi:hypothetical protein
MDAWLCLTSNHTTNQPTATPLTTKPWLVWESAAVPHTRVKFSFMWALVTLMTNRPRPGRGDAAEALGCHSPNDGASASRWDARAGCGRRRLCMTPTDCSLLARWPCRLSGVAAAMREEVVLGPICRHQADPSQRCALRRARTEFGPLGQTRWDPWCPPPTFSRRRYRHTAGRSCSCGQQMHADERPHKTEE